MGKSEEHEQRQMLRVLMFQEIQNKDLMYLHDFEKKPHFENNFKQIFLVLISTDFCDCQCFDPMMFFLQRAPSLGTFGVCHYAYYSAASGGCVFFPKRAMIFQVRTVNFLKVKKQNIDIYRKYSCFNQHI